MEVGPIFEGRDTDKHYIGSTRSRVSGFWIVWDVHDWCYFELSVVVSVSLFKGRRTYKRNLIHYVLVVSFGFLISGTWNYRIKGSKREREWGGVVDPFEGPRWRTSEEPSEGSRADSRDLDTYHSQETKYVKPKWSNIERTVCVDLKYNGGQVRENLLSTRPISGESHSLESWFNPFLLILHRIFLESIRRSPFFFICLSDSQRLFKFESTLD